MAEVGSVDDWAGDEDDGNALCDIGVDAFFPSSNEPSSFTVDSNTIRVTIRFEN
jgi:hypothetical protein